MDNMQNEQNGRGESTGVLIKRMNRNRCLVFLHLIGTLALIGLLIATIYLGVIVGRANAAAADDNKTQTYANQMEGVYQRAYYDLLADSSDMAVTLQKVSASSTSAKQETLLLDVWKTSEVALNNLGTLSPENANIETTAKFVNQLGDYCYAVSRKLARGETLSAEDAETILTLTETLTKLRETMLTVGEGGATFLSDEGGAAKTLDSIFSDLSQVGIEYPTMIYDGPFSDATEDKEVRGVDGDLLESDDVQAKLTSLFELTDVTFSGEWDTDLLTYNYEARSGGNYFSAQLTCRGGRVVSVVVSREVGAPTISLSAAKAAAATYLEKLGYEDMSAVWSFCDGGVFYLNMAPLGDDGAILYPDLIKVKVASDNGEIIGVDAQNYLFNHTKRTYKPAILSQAQAKNAVLQSLNPSEGRLALVPKSGGKEVLCYEFVCDCSPQTYVYINAYDGSEEDILICVGDLLM